MLGVRLRHVHPHTMSAMLVIVRYDLPNSFGAAIRFTVIRHMLMISVDDEL